MFTPKAAYLWEVPGRSVSVSFDYDVIDRLGAQVLSSAGSESRDSVEVGGILLGTFSSSAGFAASVEDFEIVPCSYPNPRYNLTGEDHRRFGRTVQRWRQGKSHLTPVGFFRGNNRDGITLDGQDRELLRRNFANGNALALVIEPQFSRPPQAAVFVPDDDGTYPERCPREFPFRRQELGGGNANGVLEAPVNGHATTHEFSNRTGSSDQSADRGTTGDPGGKPLPPKGTDTTVVPKRTLRLRGGWVWVPLSFIFLLMGTVLGFQVALSVQSKVVTTPTADPYALQLTATPSADSVHLRWSRTSPAVENAQRGRLVIDEDGKIKNVDLDAGHLRNGSVIYRRAGGEVSFTLEIFLKERISVAQTVEFQPVIAEPVVSQDGG